jgi:hypothetical protein
MPGTVTEIHTLRVILSSPITITITITITIAITIASTQF